jgi:hypothetical protein
LRTDLNDTQHIYIRYSVYMHIKSNEYSLAQKLQSPVFLPLNNYLSNYEGWIPLVAGKVELSPVRCAHDLCGYSL